MKGGWRRKSRAHCGARRTRCPQRRAAVARRGHRSNQCLSPRWAAPNEMDKRSRISQFSEFRNETFNENNDWVWQTLQTLRIFEWRAVSVSVHLDRFDNTSDWKYLQNVWSIARENTVPLYKYVHYSIVPLYIEYSYFLKSSNYYQKKQCISKTI